MSSLLNSDAEFSERLKVTPILAVESRNTRILFNLARAIGLIFPHTPDSDSFESLKNQVRSAVCIIDTGPDQSDAGNWENVIQAGNIFNARFHLRDGVHSIRFQGIRDH